MKLAPLAAVVFLGLAACSPKSDAGSAVKTAPSSSGNHDASGPISEAKLGVKIYPGARIVTSGETAEIVSANLETSDPATKVAEFYQKELGLEGSPSTAQIMGKKDGRTYVVSLAPSGAGTAVSIMGKK